MNETAKSSVTLKRSATMKDARDKSNSAKNEAVCRECGCKFTRTAKNQKYCLKHRREFSPRFNYILKNRDKKNNSRINAVLDLFEDGFCISPYEGYLIDYTGDIYSLKSNKILKRKYCKQGYAVTQIKNKKGNNGLKLHRAVSETFLDDFDSTLEVNHIDGDKANSCVCNLESCTLQENRNHAAERKLTQIMSEDEANIILGNYLVLDLSQKEISLLFNIQTMTVSNIYRGRWNYW